MKNNKLINWILGESRSQVNEISENSALIRYFEIAWRLSLIVLFVLIVCGLLTLIPTPGYKTDTQSLASYVGTLLGTVVALAGSIVAISLAIQALNVSKEQNRQSIASRPEYEKGLEAAMAYARFKGIVVLLPFELRQSQKIRQVDSESILKGSPDEQSLKSLTKYLLELSDTTFITLFNSIVWKSSVINGKGEDLQALFLHRFSALKATQNLLRGVQLALTMQSEIDEIVIKMHAEVMEFYSFDAYINDSESNKKSTSVIKELNEIEFWFIKHVYPYANLTNKTTFSDFNALKNGAKNSVYAFANSNGVIIDSPEFEPFNQDILFYGFDEHSNRNLIVTSMEDSSLYKILSENRNHFTTKKTKFKSVIMQVPSVEDLKNQDVIQVVFPTNWDINLAHLLQRINEVGEDRKAKILLVLDQAGLYQDSLKLNDKYFNLGQHLHIWKNFRLLTNLLAQSEIQVKQGLRIKKLELTKENLEFFRNSEDHLKRMFMWAKGLDFSNFIQSNQYHFNEILRFAGEKLNCSDDFDPHTMLSKLLLINSDHLELSFTAEELQVVDELAKSPIFQRPLYGFKYPSNSALSEYIDIPNTLPTDVQVLAYVVFDDKLKWPDNIFVEWLMVAPNENGVSHAKVYWID